MRYYCTYARAYADFGLVNVYELIAIHQAYSAQVGTGFDTMLLMNESPTHTKGQLLMSRLNDSILIDDLEENLADDPYGTAMFVMRNVVHRALLNEAMSLGEAKILVTIEELMRRLDNA